MEIVASVRLTSGHCVCGQSPGLDTGRAVGSVRAAGYSRPPGLNAEPVWMSGRTKRLRPGQQWPSVMEKESCSPTGSAPYCPPDPDQMSRGKPADWHDPHCAAAMDFQPVPATRPGVRRCRQKHQQQPPLGTPNSSPGNRQFLKGFRQQQSSPMETERSAYAPADREQRAVQAHNGNGVFSTKLIPLPANPAGTVW